MRQASNLSRDKTTAWNSGGEATSAGESDPLLEGVVPSYHQSGSIRSRRTSRSPSISSANNNFGSTVEQMNSPMEADSNIQDAYQIFNSPSQGGYSSVASSSRGYVSGSRSVRSLRRHYHMEESQNGPDQPPLLEIPEQIYGVRQAALKVLKPLTKTWVSRYIIVTNMPIDQFAHTFSFRW